MTRITAPFPECLGTRRIDQDWAVQHNRVVNAWFTDHTMGLSDEELAILNLARGIDLWVNFSGIGADGYGAPNVTYPLIEAFRAALNGSLGRLDGGTLDSWAVSVLTAVGLDEHE